MTSRFLSKSAFAAKTALLAGAVTLSGCGLVSDWIGKKADKALQEDLKRESEKNADSGKSGGSSDKPASSAALASTAGDGWTEPVTGTKVSLARVDLSSAGMKGLTMLAPEGAKVATSPGGRGADVSQVDYGFAVWVVDDPTATVDLMKEAAGALHPGATVDAVHGNGLIVNGKSIDGTPAYYYQGLFEANGKKYRCETQSSTEPTARVHAEQIAKVCESLQLDGKSIAPKTDATDASASNADAKPSEVAANDAPAHDVKRASDTTTPPRAPDAAPVKAPPPPQAAKESPPAPPTGDKSQKAPAPLRKTIPRKH